MRKDIATADRWQQVSQIYLAALERDTADRDAFLREACAGDQDLRREVESLLGYEGAADPWIERPAAAVAAPMLDTSASSSVLLGRQIGPYQIVSRLGAGGMGEVYRARDTALKRDVALKTLPPSLATDAERLARFRREAEVLASLNHLNIAAIYGLQDADGMTALVMELVEGEELAERIARRPVPVDEALPIARQIAEAPEAAHEQGIIHRDLKPANIKVRPDGTVKVLDFGLAKALEPASVAAADATAWPAITSPAMMTGVRVLLGTAAYMSPEQAKGQAADRRTDVWAFGVVLYEMLTGRRPFESEDVSDTLAAIIRGGLDWSALPADTPPYVRRVLQQCLQQDRKRRLHDIGDVRLALDQSDEPGAPSIAAPPVDSRPRWPIHLAWLTVLLGVGAAARAGGWLLPAPAPPAETRLDVNTPPTLAGPLHFAISPDGRQVVFNAMSDKHPSMLWLRPLDRTTARPLVGTEGGTWPFWSPDSRSVGFIAGGKLKRLDLAGGAPQTLADSHSLAAWGPANVILYNRARDAPGLMRIPAIGGESTPVTKLADGATSHVQPQFLPDGRQFVFFVNGPENVRGVYLGSLDDPQITRLTDAAAAARYLAPGWLAYIRGGSLVARRLDLSSRTLAGDPVQIADRIAYGAVSGWAGFSASTAGVIAYRAEARARRQLTWFDRKGAVLGTFGPVDDTITDPALSPDAQRAAVQRRLQNQTDIWVMDTRFIPFHVWSESVR